ncbi:MAG: hypothetical protein GX278_02355 [Aeromonadales bacterium]|nr:hypothetical protein [Aeromonadales bacterium]
MKIKVLNSRKLCAIALLTSAFVLSACNSYYFDSSVGPDGKKVILDDSAKKANTQKKSTKTSAKRKTVKQTTSSATSANVAKAFNDDLKAGVVKPYVPDNEGASNTSSLLPTVNVQQNNSDNPLSKVSVQDVVSGKVNLNDLNSQNSSTNTQNETETVQTLPQAFVPDENALQNQNLTNLKQPEETTLVVSNDANSLEQQSNSALKEKCGANNTAVAQQVAYKIALKQAERLKSETGPIYIAPTVVPNKLQDCIGDLTDAINQALTNAGIQTVVGSGVDVSQNSGSSTVIPSLVRACKSTGVPLLNVSIIRTIGTNTVVTIRNIRVKDGITLVQNTTSL